ncbi:MAG: T9SS type A sorting domain-containing protein [Crocinitomicaceae bacterium]
MIRLNKNFISKTFHLSIALVFFALSSQAQVNFFRTFSNQGSGEEPGRCVKQLSNGDYLLLGITDGNLCLTKLNSTGQQLFSKTYESPNGHSIHAERFMVATNGDIIIAGSKYNGSLTTTVVMRISNAGQIIWTKEYDSDAGIAAAITETSMGNFAIAGNKMQLFVIDGIGNIVSTYGTRKFSGFYNGIVDIHTTTDGGLIMIGNPTGSIGSYDYVLIKTDAIGNLQWSKNYGGSDHDFGHSVLQTPDGGYIMSGFTKSFGNNLGTKSDILLIKTDANGNQQWTKTYGRQGKNDFARGMVIAPDGGYLMVGWTEGQSDFFDILSVKTDAQGNLQWSKTYNHADMDGASSIDLTQDGGFVFTGGEINSFPFSNDMYIVKTDGLGNIGTTCNGSPQIIENVITQLQIDSNSTFNDNPISGTTVSYISTDINPIVLTVCNEISTSVAEVAQQVISFYPNPVENVLVIKGEHLQNVDLKLYSTLGVLVKEIECSGVGSCNFNMSNISSGTYLIELNNRKISEKMYYKIIKQ